jgi:uncharacterized membrane protein YfcA
MHGAIPMDVPQVALLFAAALLSGAINGVAGGGGLIAFPTLLLVGVPPVSANATNTAALWLGTVASTAAYRQELSTHRRELVLFTGVSVVGGLVGARLLLHTSSDLFAVLVPYLLLLATLLFAIGQPFAVWLSRCHLRRMGKSPGAVVFVLLLQFGIAVYGGFFGGGSGILMLAALSFTGISNIHTLNAFKSWLATSINGVAIVQFVAAGAIAWPQASVMAVGALVGGYGSARYARQVDPSWVRNGIVSLGFAISVYCFAS